jgi:hypothetical protein
MPSRDLFPSDWLVTGTYRDTRLGVIKAGKESEVHLVARTGSDRTTLLAEKRFKARDRRSFQNNYVYRGVWGEGTYREDRAMKKNTRFGHEAALGGGHRGEGAGAVGAYGANAHVRPPLVSSPRRALAHGTRWHRSCLEAAVGTARRTSRRLIDVTRLLPNRATSPTNSPGRSCSRSSSVDLHLHDDGERNPTSADRIL